MSEALKTPEPQAESQNVSVEEQASPQVEKKTPGKRPRLSFIERAQKESEELVKTLGGSLELEGGRRTRSSARGTPTRPVATPPPAKKSRNSPASPKAATPRGRGRGRKLDTSVTPEPPEPKGNVEQEAEKAVENETPVEEDQTAESAKSTEAAKTKESSETNGPEKSEAENVDAPDTVKEPKAAEKQAEAVVADKSAETPASGHEPNDQVDAAAPKPITEKSSQSAAETEHKNQTGKVSEPTTAKPAEVVAVDSPMEVDDQSNSAVAASKTIEEAAAAEIVPVPKAETATSISTEPAVADKSDIATIAVQPVVEKQPTPEPMEVDSSSKSSDVIECTDVVDKADETTTAVQSTSNDIDSTNSHAVKVAVAAEKPIALPPITATENNLKNEVNANVAANDIPAVKSIEEPVTIGDQHVDNNKNENDVDQQKLAAAASHLNAAGGGEAPVHAVPSSL